MGSDARGHFSMDSDQYLTSLERFLSSPLPKSLFATHPNDAAKPSFIPPPEWEPWWDWAASTPEPWTELLTHYVTVLNSDLYSLADSFLPLDRTEPGRKYSQLSHPVD